MPIKVFAVTGGISVGKSAAVAKLKSHANIIIFDTDEITHQLQKPGQEGYEQIKKEFPSVIKKNGNGEIDRQALADLIFDPSPEGQQKRKILEMKIMQPLIMKFIFTSIFALWFEKLFSSPTFIVIVDAPVLIEMQKKISSLVRLPFSGVLVVTCSQDVQLKRLMARGAGCNELEARKRIAAQLPLAEKEKAADFIIRNDTSIRELEMEVRKAVDWMQNKNTMLNGWNRIMIGLGTFAICSAVGGYYLSKFILSFSW